MTPFPAAIVVETPADQFTPEGRKYLLSKPSITYLALADGLAECVVFDVTGPAPAPVLGAGFAYASPRTVVALSEHYGPVLLGKFAGSRECVQAAYALWAAN